MAWSAVWQELPVSVLSDVALVVAVEAVLSAAIVVVAAVHKDVSVDR